MLNLKPNFLKIYVTNPMILCSKRFVEQGCSFDIQKYCSGLLISEILKMSGSNFSVDMFISFMLIKLECMKCEKR